MSADLTCPTCEGTGYFVCKWPGCEQRHPSKRCSQCGGRGRRPPKLDEWNALKAERDQAKDAVRTIDTAFRTAFKERNDALDERDRYREALEFYANPGTYHAVGFFFDKPCGGFDEDFSADHGDPFYDRSMPGATARAALDSEPDLAERTRRIRADE